MVLYLAHRATFGASGKDALYPERARRFVHDHAAWLWPTIATLAILSGLVFLRWLLVQPRTDRLTALVIDTDPFSRPDDPAAVKSAGRSLMPAHALTNIVEDDISAVPGVHRVAAGVSGPTDSPQLWLSVTTDFGANLAEIRDTITGVVITDARACLDMPQLLASLRLHVGGPIHRKRSQ